MIKYILMILDTACELVTNKKTKQNKKNQWNRHPFKMSYVKLLVTSHTESLTNSLNL